MGRTVRSLLFAAFAVREQVIFWDQHPLSVHTPISIQLLVNLWRYSVLHRSALTEICLGSIAHVDENRVI